MRQELSGQKAVQTSCSQFVVEPSGLRLQQAGADKTEDTTNARPFDSSVRQSSSPIKKNSYNRQIEESGKICIRVELPNGVIRELGSFNRSDQGSTIKSKIHDLEGLKPNFTRLIIGGKELRDDMLLSSRSSDGVHEERARISLRCLGGMDDK